MNSAILRYSGAPIQDPAPRTWLPVNPLNESSLQAYGNPGVPGVPGVGNADVSINLVGQINATTALFEINNVSFTPPPIPVLLQILSGAVNLSQLQPQGSVYTLPRNKTVEVSFPGQLLLAAVCFTCFLRLHSLIHVRTAPFPSPWGALFMSITTFPLTGIPLCSTAPF